MLNRAEDELSRTFAALADPTRRDILARLSVGEATVGALAAAYRMSAPAVSHHLKVLETAGLVDREVRARHRTISLHPGALDAAADWVDRCRGDWNERLDRLEAFLTRRRHPMTELDFTLTRSLAAPVREVWDAWTDPDQLAQWHFPQETSVPRDSVTVDLRVGGRYTYTMVAEDGSGEFPTAGVYREIDPPHRLVYTWGAPGEEETAPVVTLELAERPDGGTDLTFTLRGTVADEVTGVHDGWEQALDSLVGYLGRDRS